jgi:hypothetical protein
MLTFITQALHLLLFLGLPIASNSVAGGSTAIASDPFFGSSETRHDVVYEVWNNGVKCDGFTDDTEAFNTLIAKVGSAGGGNIILPAATCIVTHVNLANNVHILGKGRGSTTIRVKNNAGDYEAIFGTNKSTFINVGFADLTIDQNTTANPLTPKGLSAKSRFVIATGAGSSQLTVERVELKDLANVNTIYSGSEFTNITDSAFSLNCGGSVYHDHSTVYVAAEHSQTRHNIFRGCVNAAGSVTAIETHGGSQTIVANTIDDYWIGMNITGVAATESSNVSVTDNSIKGAYYGIQLWSNRYHSHTTGCGLHGVTIESNVVRLTQAAWTRNPVTGGQNAGNPSGVWVNAESNLPLAVITIQRNTIEYDLETGGSAPYDPSGVGIGYWDSTNGNSITSLKVLGNTIKNATLNAIRVSANGSDFDISGNIIINPGSSANSGLSAGYRNGILIASTTALKGVRVNNNTITDNQSTSRMVRGIYFAAARGSELSAVGNKFAITGASITSLRSFVDCDNDVQLPFVQGFVESPRITLPLLPSCHVAPGSTFTTQDHVYHVNPDSRTWTPGANHS